MVDSQYLKQYLSKFDFDKPSEYDKPELEQFFQCIPYIRKAAIYCVKCLHESRRNKDYTLLKERQKQNQEGVENIQNIFNDIKSSESIYSGLIEDLSKFQYHLSNMKVSMEACLYGIKSFNLNDNNTNDNIVRLSTYLFETGSTVYVSIDTNSRNVLSALFAARYFQQFKEDLSDLDKVKYSVFMEFFHGFGLPLIKSKIDNEKDLFMEGFTEKDSSMKEVKRSYTDFKVTYDFLSTNQKIQSLANLP